jgi:CheY-like chemotaxis protein
MSAGGKIMPDTILIVDDEESVRRTFREWLTGANLDCTILVAADAESALRQAQSQLIDLAILDWNLGTGMDGLRLLEDLSVFCPNIVAILVTGYANQATPLMALRMGVRDFLDKSHELTRETFLTAVRKQLEKIRPAKRHRELHETLAAFRSSVEQVLPLVQSSAALTDPVPIPQAVRSLCQFVRQAIGATDAVLVVQSNDDLKAFSSDGDAITTPLASFSRTLAASALALGEPSIVGKLDASSLDGTDVQPFEKSRSNLLAVPMRVGPRITAVLELFDKPAPGFTEQDRKLASAAANVGVELLKQTLADVHTHQTLFTAVEAALRATDAVPLGAAPQERLPDSVRESLRRNLDQPGTNVTGAAALELAEAVQLLSTKYGEPAVQHCVHLIHEVAKLLDAMTEP